MAAEPRCGFVWGFPGPPVPSGCLRGLSLAMVRKFLNGSCAPGPPLLLLWLLLLLFLLLLLLLLLQGGNL